MPRLLIVLLEPLSDLVAKGEVVARYYNPGDVFGDIHFLLLNPDRPEGAALDLMCGRAKVTVHNLPLAPGLFVRTLGWRPELMRRELAEAAVIARGIGPDLVRTHGAGLNGLFANHIGKALGRPVLLSLHNRPDAVLATSTGDWLRQKAMQMLAARVLRGADEVMIVYKAQQPYLTGLRVEGQLAYNMIGSTAMPVKADYGLASPARAISVGRQFRGKDVANVIAAVASLPEVHFTVVGDGPLHGALLVQAEAAGLAGRTTFHKALANAELCATLHSYDLFVSHNDHPGVPKAVMEPMLAGLPVVMNRIGGGADADIEGAAVLVENTPEAYRGAIWELLTNGPRRRAVGQACRERALATWEPAAAEARQEHLARHLLEGSRRKTTARA